MKSLEKTPNAHESLYGSMLGKLSALVRWDYGPAQETIFISIL